MCQVVSCVSFTDICIEYKINDFQYLTVLFQEVGQVQNTQAEVKWHPCASINSNVCHLEHKAVSIIKYVVKAVHYLTLHFISKTNFRIIIVHMLPLLT